MRLLDRYVLRRFLEAYLYCIAAFISVWLIFDISENISVFLDERVSLGMVLNYYLTQVPQILVILLPYSLLLALLFSLGRMSRTNEIVSMLTAGVSVPRLLVPLLTVGVLTTAVSGVLNYELAPHAEMARKNYFDVLRPQQARELWGQIFRNRADNRTWFLQRLRPGQNDFLTIQVLQQDENDNIVKSYFASTAVFHPEEKTWEMRGARTVNYDLKGNILGEENYETLVIKDWSETPFRLASTNMRAELLSVPELRDYLRFNFDFPRTLLAPFATHLQYRLALPWFCLVVVFLAAPLSIAFSRGGILSSVAAAIALVFLTDFFNHLFLALGEGDRIAPLIAAWTSQAFFAAIGLVLLYFRSTNRDIRTLNPFTARAASL